MSSIPEILQKFEPITLEEMEGVKLMNRTDTKFVFTLSQYEAIMDEIREHYKVLEIGGTRLSKYKTLYYDTPQYDLYADHHNGKLNRFKIRHRTYVETAAGFLEVKFKNNKGRTIKERIRKNEVLYAWEDESRNFLTKKLPFEPATLVPVLWVNYSRHTLVSKSGPERLTVDLELEFVKDNVSRKLDALVIAEVKQEKRQPSPFVKVMKKYHIREGSISKYCMGIALTCNNVKKNNFKPKLLNLKHKLL